MVLLFCFARLMYHGFIMESRDLFTYILQDLFTSTRTIVCLFRACEVTLKKYRFVKTQNKVHLSANCVHNSLGNN